MPAEWWGHARLRSRHLRILDLTADFGTTSMFGESWGSNVSYPQAPWADGGDESERGATKTCIVCQCTSLQPSALDLLAKRTTRAWGQRQTWGPLCNLCKKSAQVKYSFMSTPAFVAWVELHENNRVEAAAYSYAFMTLKEDGRSHIDFDLLESRVRFLKRVLEEFPHILGQTAAETHLLNEYMDRHPHTNPIEQGWTILQLVSQGLRRLGVRVPTTATRELEDTASSWAPAGVIVHPSVRTDEPTDLDLLRTLAAKCKPLAKKSSEQSPGKIYKAASRDNFEASAAQSDDDEHQQEPAESSAPVPDSASPFPKGRLGNAVRKSDLKVNSMLSQLQTPDWRLTMKDSSLRSNLRSTAGLHIELQSCEYPSLIQVNESHTDVFTTMELFRSASPLSTESSPSGIYASCAGRSAKSRGS